jgi:transcriptional regulator with XRE-family HTH domain
MYHNKKKERGLMAMKKKIRELRFRRGWTPKDLARQIGVSVRTVQRWERGSHLPRLDTMELLCQALGCSPADLLGDEDRQAPHSPPAPLRRS